jgi:hypothetical protein
MFTSSVFSAFSSILLSDLPFKQMTTFHTHIKPTVKANLVREITLCAGLQGFDSWHRRHFLLCHYLQANPEAHVTSKKKH